MYLDINMPAQGIKRILYIQTKMELQAPSRCHFYAALTFYCIMVYDSKAKSSFNFKFDVNLQTGFV